MAYTAKRWSERVQSRIDVCSQISHLTRAASIDGKPHSALQIIIKILRERRIEPSTTESGFIVGDTPAICFHDAPLYSICQNIEFERKLAREIGAKKHRYEPVGLSFPKPYVYGCGARPVFYEKTNVARDLLPADQWWRIVNFDLSNQENFIDWTHEREWRLPGPFNFDIQYATVLVPNTRVFKNFLRLGSSDGENVAEKVRCVITLGSLYA